VLCSLAWLFTIFFTFNGILINLCFLLKKKKGTLKSTRLSQKKAKKEPKEQSPEGRSGKQVARRPRPNHINSDIPYNRTEELN
jgi:hypothetical protein